MIRSDARKQLAKLLQAKTETSTETYGGARPEKT